MLSLALTMCLALGAIGCASTASPHPADASLAQLASAFERKDAAEARGLINDGWSGSRFWSDWTDDAWARAARTLRSARLKSASDSERVYTVTEGSGRTHDIRMQRSDDGWRLDYESLHGPFPHM